MGLLREKLEEVALRHFSKGSLYGLKEEVIQSKKVENTIDIHRIDKANLLFLYDATVFGSAKDGVVFTHRGIYWREPRGDSYGLDYNEIVESTANKNINTNEILVFDKADVVVVKDSYYRLICDIREELISSFIVYETYYKSALTYFEEILSKLFEEKKYAQILRWRHEYRGLFLNNKDKTAQLLKISFQAYLIEKEFTKAQKELDFLKDKSSKFYNHAAPLLEQAINEEQYAQLEDLRILAIKEEDFEEAYTLFEQQRNLNVGQKKDIMQKELQTKSAHYQSLNKDRLKALRDERYDLAFFLLEKQRQLKLKEDFQIKIIKDFMMKSKEEALESHIIKLKSYLRNKDIPGAEQEVNKIYKIDAAYSLEKEELMIMLYKHQIQEAENFISKINDSSLKISLEEIYEATIKEFYDEIQSKAREKDYDYFELFPDIWDHKDQYAMSALHYFALEADLKGILRALDGRNPLLMEANIFGHNFVDMIGFACDSNLGKKDTEALDILEKIKEKSDLKQINDRIEFLKTGQEGYFFSYELSQAARLSQLNQRLISMGHFKNLYNELQNHKKNNLNEIIKHIFGQELEALDSYPQKDQFEKSQEYRKRCLAFKGQYFQRTDFIEEYKRQNKAMVEGIGGLVKDGTNYFLASLSALVEYKNKDLEALKSLESPKDVLGLMDLYFPRSEEMISVEIGTYDADQEVFLVMINGKREKVAMPLAIAAEFKETFHEMEFMRRRIIEDNQIRWGTVPRYSSKIKRDGL